jgi:altronate hydrolase
MISARDNVATALESLDAGRVVAVDGVVVTASQRIPRGHKIALRSIRAGEPVMKYGNNVSSARGRGDLAQVHASAPRLAEPIDLDGHGSPEDEADA